MKILNLDYLDKLSENAFTLIDKGYYNYEGFSESFGKKFDEAIREQSGNSIITELKFFSPSSGKIIDNKDHIKLAREMVEGNAVGLSILTEPNYFGGSIANFLDIRRKLDIPILMKDFLVSKKQVDTAKKIGADAILLIIKLFEKNKCDTDLDNMISYAHSYGLQVLLEAHDLNEFDIAIETNAELVGINNRDLTNLKIDLSTTIEILKNRKKGNQIIISESGIQSSEDIRVLKDSGADAFLVGTAIMKSSNIKSKVRELVEA